MDRDTEINRLKAERDQIENYLNHPITRHIIDDNQERQDALLKLIVDREVIDLRSFFEREQNIGRLREVRYARTLLEGGLREIDERIREL